MPGLGHAKHFTCSKSVQFYMHTHYSTIRICSISNRSLCCRWRSWPTSPRSPVTTARRCTPSSSPPGFTACAGRRWGWAAAAAGAQARAAPLTRTSGWGGYTTQVRTGTMETREILIWPGSSDWSDGQCALHSLHTSLRSDFAHQLDGWQTWYQEKQSWKLDCSINLQCQCGPGCAAFRFAFQYKLTDRFV